MANICKYKVIVRGKKNACYAFFGSMSCMDYKEILRESGDNENCEVMFEGTCKWAVDMYCNPFSGEKPVQLPEDPDEAYKEAENNYWYNTVQERSEMFQVEVLCNSIDIDEFNPDWNIWEHYISGKPVYDDDDEMPEELEIADSWD